MNDTERRIETLKLAIRWNSVFLGTVCKGADPKTEKQLEDDRAELAKLLAETEAA